MIGLEHKDAGKKGTMSEQNYYESLFGFKDQRRRYTQHTEEISDDTAIFQLTYRRANGSPQKNKYRIKIDPKREKEKF